MNIERLKRLVGIQYEFKLELDNFLSDLLEAGVVADYDSLGNTPALRADMYDKFVACGPSMGFSAKQFAYGLLEMIIAALVDNPDVPADPYINALNDQLINVSRYVGLEGEEDFHFMVAVYNLGVTLADLVDSVNNSPTGTVTISGDAVEGETLTASNTIADADGVGVISYQWKADGEPIEDATSSTYVLTGAEVGAVITVTATYVDGKGNPESVTSAPTATVTAIE